MSEKIVYNNDSARCGECGQLLAADVELCPICKCKFDSERKADAIEEMFEAHRIDGVCKEEDRKLKILFWVYQRKFRWNS